jgi:hypothetical protein
MIELMYKAANITRSRETSAEDAEFVKLAVSSTFLMMNEYYRERICSILSKSQVDAINKVCEINKGAFEDNKVHDDLIDLMFDRIKEFQFE